MTEALCAHIKEWQHITVQFSLQVRMSHRRNFQPFSEAASHRLHYSNQLFAVKSSQAKKDYTKKMWKAAATIVDGSVI